MCNVKANGMCNSYGMTEIIDIFVYIVIDTMLQIAIFYDIDVDWSKSKADLNTGLSPE